MSSSRHIYVYQGVYLAKEGFSQVASVHISLDGSVFKYLQEEVINNIINTIILQLIVTVSTNSVTSVNSFISRTI